MHGEDADPHDRVEKGGDALGELILVGQKGDQHAHRERAGHHCAGAKKDDHDAVQPEQHRIDRPKHQVEPLQPQTGADLVNEIVVPAGLPALANDQRLNARHAAQRFDEMRVLLRGGHDRLFIGPAIESVGQAARQPHR